MSRNTSIVEPTTTSIVSCDTSVVEPTTTSIVSCDTGILDPTTTSIVSRDTGVVDRLFLLVNCTNYVIPFFLADLIFGSLYEC